MYRTGRGEMSKQVSSKALHQPTPTHLVHLADTECLLLRKAKGCVMDQS